MNPDSDMRIHHSSQRHQELDTILMYRLWIPDLWIPDFKASRITDSITQGDRLSKLKRLVAVCDDHVSKLPCHDCHFSIKLKSSLPISYPLKVALNKEMCIEV